LAESSKLILLFCVGMVCGFINVNAGGGSSLTLPVLIFLGLDSGMANGTNRIGILVQNFFAVSSFRRQKVHHFKKSSMLALFTLPGAIVGALLSVRLSNLWFQRILGIVMIGIVLSMMFYRPKKDNPSENPTAKNTWLIYPAMIGIGFYGGFIQNGVGFLLMASLYYILRISLVRVNMHKVYIVCLYTIPALAVFILSGNVNWLYGCILAAGMALGGWWGAKIAVRGGEKVIRGILAAAILIMAAKLLRLY
jgi:uncharacterized membrane protein YfcA